MITELSKFSPLFHELKENVEVFVARFSEPHERSALLSELMDRVRQSRLPLDQQVTDLFCALFPTARMGILEVDGDHYYVLNSVVRQSHIESALFRGPFKNDLPFRLLEGEERTSATWVRAASELAKRLEGGKINWEGVDLLLFFILLDRNLIEGDLRQEYLHVACLSESVVQFAVTNKNARFYFDLMEARLTREPSARFVPVEVGAMLIEMKRQNWTPNFEVLRVLLEIFPDFVSKHAIGSPWEKLALQFFEDEERWLELNQGLDELSNRELWMQIQKDIMYRRLSPSRFVKRENLTTSNMKILIGFLRRVESLEEIELKDCWIDESFYKELPRIKGLKRLSLPDNHLKMGGLKPLTEVLSQMTSLEELNLENNQIGEEGVTRLGSVLKHMKKLRSLNLSYNFDDQDVVAFAEYLRDCPQIEHLFLGGNCIRSDGINALFTAFERLPNLERLDLSDNWIDSVPEVLGMKRLRQLNLARNKIGNEGAKALAQGIDRFPNLKYLDLSRNPPFAIIDLMKVCRSREIILL